MQGLFDSGGGGAGAAGLPPADPVMDHLFASELLGVLFSVTINQMPYSGLWVLSIAHHKHDAARAEDALTLSYGSKLIGMQRDWNEELQSCREFPHRLLRKRVMHDRVLYKVTSDFVGAAISGATGVINRCVHPINPTDPECFHMSKVA
uniref:Clu domain-containing protein n=1 Tax=Nelumbo nucifera TaxID=4432 RepID=A0A822ZYB1_NELNU|nr:TPA_asm: hypothetical protein HUJ06_018282 [Nelumbo nucifera]